MPITQLIMARNTSGGGGGGGGGGGSYPVPGDGFYQASWPDSAGWSAQGSVGDPGSGVGSITNQTNGWIRRTYSATWSVSGSGGNNNPSVFNGTAVNETADVYGGFGTTSVNENYCMEWKGYFVPPVTGTYNFLLDSDDVAMFWIGDGALNPESVGPICTANNSNQLNPNSVALTQNTAYPIRMRFQEWSGNERCQVFVGRVGTGTPLYAMQNWSSSVYYNGLTMGYNT
jgi:hypothetical protein